MIGLSADEMKRRLKKAIDAAIPAPGERGEMVKRAEHAAAERAKQHGVTKGSPLYGLHVSDAVIEVVIGELRDILVDSISEVIAENNRKLAEDLGVKSQPSDQV